MCQHQTPCPTVESVDRDAARTIAAFPEQGWSLLCNGAILFDDNGEVLPDGTIIASHMFAARHKKEDEKDLVAV